MSDDHIQNVILVIEVISVILSCTVPRIVTVHSKVMNPAHSISCTLPFASGVHFLVVIQIFPLL